MKKNSLKIFVFHFFVLHLYIQKEQNNNQKKQTTMTTQEIKHAARVLFDNCVTYYYNAENGDEESSSLFNVEFSRLVKAQKWLESVNDKYFFRDYVNNSQTINTSDKHFYANNLLTYPFLSLK